MTLSSEILKDIIKLPYPGAVHAWERYAHLGAKGAMKQMGKDLLRTAYPTIYDLTEKYVNIIKGEENLEQNVSEAIKKNPIFRGINALRSSIIDTNKILAASVQLRAQQNYILQNLFEVMGMGGREEPSPTDSPIRPPKEEAIKEPKTKIYDKKKAAREEFERTGEKQYYRDKNGKLRVLDKTKTGNIRSKIIKSASPPPVKESVLAKADTKVAGGLRTVIRYANIYAVVMTIYDGYIQIKALDPLDPNYRVNITKIVAKLVAEYGLIYVGAVLGGLVGGLGSAPAGGLGAIPGIITGIIGGAIAKYAFGNSVDKLVDYIIDKIVNKSEKIEGVIPDLKSVINQTKTDETLLFGILTFKADAISVKANELTLNVRTLTLNRRNYVGDIGVSGGIAGGKRKPERYLAQNILSELFGIKSAAAATEPPPSPSAERGSTSRNQATRETPNVPKEALPSDLKLGLGKDTKSSESARFSDKVDPKLKEVINDASKYLPEGYKIEFTSGYRPGDPRFHGKGMALDIQIIDDKGNRLGNYQNAATFRAYEQFAQIAKKIQSEKYPDMSFRWGGYFGGPAGKYGATDLMHFDIGGIGMAGGSFEKGLTEEQHKLIPGAQSQGMGDISKFSLPDSKIAKTESAEVPLEKRTLRNYQRIPSYQAGTPFVPETGPAILHKGEAVIPAPTAQGISQELSELRKKVVYPPRMELHRAMQERGFNDPKMRAALGGIVMGESGGQNVSESFAYKSARRLKNVFRSAIKNIPLAKELIRGGEEAIQKHVYGPSSPIGKRLGNLTPEDAIKYSGRGPVQITGRASYEAVSSKIGQNLIDNPDLANDPYWGPRAAVAFAESKKARTPEQLLQRVGGVRSKWGEKRQKMREFEGEYSRPFHDPWDSVELLQHTGYVK